MGIIEKIKKSNDLKEYGKLILKIQQKIDSIKEKRKTMETLLENETDSLKRTFLIWKKENLEEQEDWLRDILAGR